MRGRRFLLIVALLMGLTALAASFAPQDPRVQSSDDPPPAETSTPDPGPPSDTTREVTISADERGQRVVAEEGELLQLTVTSSELDTVTIGELGETATVEPDSDAVLSLLAEPPGEHPIRLLESERRIGTLVID